MVILQEYLNEKFPTPKAKKEVKEIKINSKNPLKKVEGGELIIKDWPDLQELWINWNYLKTPLTKWEISNCPKLDFCVILSSSMYKNSKNKIALFTEKSQKTKQRKKE